MDTTKFNIGQDSESGVTYDILVTVRAQDLDSTIHALAKAEVPFKFVRKNSGTLF